MPPRTRAVDIVNPERLDPEFGSLGLVDMSWSRAETYDVRWSTFACPRKYKHKYVDHEDDGWTIHLATGSISHDTLEWCVKNDVEDEMELIGKFIGAVDTHDPENRMTDMEINDAKQITINAFRNMHQVVSNMRDVVDVERGFRYIIGRGMFLGFIDLMFWDTDEHGRFLHIMDYKTSGMDKKTGRPRKKTKDHGQMALYTLVAKKLFPGVRVKASLYWLRCEKPELKIDTYEFSEEELAEFERRMAITVDNIIEDESFQVTKKGFICQYCNFACDDICKFGAMLAKRAYGYQKKKKAS